MSAEETRFAKLLETADKVEQFSFYIGGWADSDRETAELYSFKHLAKLLIGLARRINNQSLRDTLRDINTDIHTIYEAYDLKADLQLVIDDIRHLAQHPEESQWEITTSVFVELSVISELKATTAAKFDLSKVARLCEELNSSYAAGNYLASILLIRMLLNHVPPIFGHQTFAQVVSNAPRSMKDLLRPLEEKARDVADHHTHSLVRHKECLPTKGQIEPFKPNIELLLHELIVEATKAG